MALSPQRLMNVLKVLQITAIGAMTFALVATAVLIWLESTWAVPVFRDPEKAFRHGSIGTEVMPLPVAHVLPELFPEHFQPAGANNDDWVEQFGFIPSDDPENDGLPVGFALSNYRPQSASPSPVTFVGFSCVLCHSSRVEVEETKTSKLVLGPGNVSLNLFSWLDAFQAAVLDREKSHGGSEPPPYRLTLEKIEETYRDKKGRRLSLAEKAMVGLWLRQIRDRFNEGLPRFDEPYGHGRSRDPALVPTGPARTQPFRTLVRQVLERPGNDMPVYTKIAAVFGQEHRKWAQFDGTIADLHVRSSMAAFAAGATVENMAHPEIAHNIRQASEYTKKLQPPPFAELFPEYETQVDADQIARGRKVFRAYCFSCHGDRDSERKNEWTPGPRQNEIVPLKEIGTDPERVQFRHYGELGGKMHLAFPKKHPFHVARDQIRPLPGEEDDLAKRGYVNGALDGAYLRGPYLHNASVLTLAELIHLKKRRDVFFRGRNFYDPVAVGLGSPAAADARHYFRYDATVRGNSNQGHDYPWRWDDPKRNEKDLRDLLEYLKTL